jgi:hypothetical protein
MVIVLKAVEMFASWLSFPRRRESSRSIPRHRQREELHQLVSFLDRHQPVIRWIPAFAGMTDKGENDGRVQPYHAPSFRGYWGWTKPGSM